MAGNKLKSGGNILIIGSYLFVSIIAQIAPQQLLLQVADVADIRLEKLNIYPQYITLSGFSSGGTFAQQLQFSYSSLFSGIAVFSHSYYLCGPGDGLQATYDNVCTTLGNFPRENLWNPRLSLLAIENYFRQGLVENPANLRNKRLYVFAGTENALFTLDQSLAILNIYEPYILNNLKIRTRVKAANLTLPSHRFGGPCAADSQPTFYISNCDLPGAFESLNFLLGEAVSHLPLANEAIPLQPLRTFDQSEFFFGVEGRHEMDSIGFIYIPTNCLTSKCLLHFYFHGCSAGREFVGDNHIRNSGFLEVAELNNIIIIFPQVLRNNNQNDIGCWDTYGHTGPLFATQRGGQVTVVRNILARVLGEDVLLPSYGNALSLNALVPAAGIGKFSRRRGVVSKRAGVPVTRPVTPRAPLAALIPRRPVTPVTPRLRTPALGHGIGALGPAGPGVATSYHVRI